MEESGTDDERDGHLRRRAAQPRRNRRLLRKVGATLVAVLVLALLSGVLVYQRLISNVDTVDAFDDIVVDRPAATPASREALDILLIGDDTREGAGSGRFIGDYSPGLSDTTILLHVSADRSRAYAISVPRDTIVDRPACRSKNNPDNIIPATSGVMWNAAHAVGGPACATAQFEQMTGVRLDHVAVLRFPSIVSMVDALDGVEICVPETVRGFGKVMLEEGTYLADGETARLYVQIRKQMGDGSDLGRIKRQQRFLSSMMARLTSTGTLTNPVRLYRFLDASTKAVDTDPELVRFRNLIGLTLDSQRIGLEQVEFLTMPVAAHDADPDRLAIGGAAERLWAELRNDDPVSALAAATKLADEDSGSVAIGSEDRDDGLC